MAGTAILFTCCSSGKTISTDANPTESKVMEIFLLASLGRCFHVPPDPNMYVTALSENPRLDDPGFQSQ